MKKILLAFLSLLMLTSCWDLTEIEEIGFVLALGIDPLTEQDRKDYQEKYKKETGKSAKKNV